MFAVVDIETTGGNAQHARITEIAIFVHNGERIVDEFCTLLNPETNIPYFITRLTGITNEMCEGAPRFFEVARRITEMTAGCTFVAHNVGFDYNFVRQEFKRLGYAYQRPTLCTVQTSRKLFPGFPSYSLGRLCESMGIPLSDRHRAAGDALATVKLLERILAKNAEGQSILKSEKPVTTIFNPDFDPEQLHSLPEETGVYYFLNAKDEVIYVGKSTNIRARVMSHFQGARTRRTLEMLSSITRIDTELTGSELVALLLESDRIKALRPVYNRLQRRALMQYGYFADLDPQGYIRFDIRRIEGKEQALTSFSSMEEARKFVSAWVEEFELCQKLAGLYQGAGACFAYGIHQCRGACISEEPLNDYNKRAENLIKRIRFHHPDFFVIDKGRNPQERSVIHVENGIYKGFGYLDAEAQISSHEELASCVKPFPDNRDVRHILKSFLDRKRVEKIIRY